jgi:hypothetical protein
MQNPPEFSDTYIRALLKKHEIVMRTPIMIEAVSYSVEKLSNLMIVSSIRKGSFMNLKSRHSMSSIELLDATSHLTIISSSMSMKQ